MAIQVRRGNESDFDASKMLPGEWAVSLDTKYVRMCFAPGVVLRMATYEGFEADKAQFQAILAECKNIQSAVQRIQAEVNSKASLVVEYSNNAKISADKAHSEAERAKTYADNAEAVTRVRIATQERAGLIKGGDNYIAEDGTLMLITTTNSTTQPNSYAGREHILEIGGLMEQGSTSGKNIFGFGKSAIDVTAELRPNSAQRLKLSSVENEPNKVKCNFVGGNYSTGYIAIDGVDGTKDWVVSYDIESNTTSYTPTMKKDKTNSSAEQLVLQIDGGNNGNTVGSSQYFVLSNIQVEEGTVATAYEPYSGGIPAPNPSYPQEIKKSVVSGIRTHHKNFLKNEWENKLPTSENTNPLRARCKKVIPIRKGVAYTFSANDYTTYKYALNASRTIAYPFNINEIHSLGNSADWLNKDFTFTALDDGYLSVVVSRVDNANLSLEEVAKLKIQFEASPIATPYEPYTESAITLSQPIELYGMGDVQDTVENGEIIRRIGNKEVVFWGSKNVLTNSKELRCTQPNDASRGTPFLCTKGRFVEETWGVDTVGICGWAGTSEIALRAGIDTETVTADIAYQLATPTTEALPIADQIALNSLQTYDGITYVEIDAEIQPTFKAEYGTSKVGGYTLEGMLAGRNGELYGKDYNSRLSALEASVVNNI